MHNGDSWLLSNIYGPCDELERIEFIPWFRDCDVDDTINWLFWETSTFIALWKTKTDLVAT